jgi:hypothetical protein
MEIKDSGQRTEFETGAVRDMHSGKGRIDLLPWEALADGTEHSKEAMDFVAACHIAVKALREIAYLKSQNSKLHSEVEAAVNDMQRLVIFSADPCEVCAGPGNCEICHFQWRGVEG